jgi:hypothetical protein
MLHILHQHSSLMIGSTCILTVTLYIEILTLPSIKMKQTVQTIGLFTWEKKVCSVLHV